MSDPVLFEKLPLKNGLFLGNVTLNVEKTLNSLSLEMIDLMLGQLEAWKTDDDIQLVLFQGAGGRAFSAGGDIQALYHSMLEHPGGPNPYAEAFFEREYRLDYMIHTYPKPTLAFAHGIVMGGGLGVMGACDFRIGTEKTRIAMPEITIGLFPDAGATWLFSQMAVHWAYFLAWTGCSVNGRDSLQLGFINYLINYALKADFIARLQAQDWSVDLAQDLTEIIHDFESKSSDFPEGEVDKHDVLVKEIMSDCLDSDNPVLAFNSSLEKLSGDAWLDKAALSFSRGTPTTAQIIHEQFTRAKGMSLKEMFKLELVIAVQCARHPDFTEGVRALLIEKDNQPAWRYAEMGAVPKVWIDEHFEEPWDKHPLDDLYEEEAS